MKRGCEDDDSDGWVDKQVLGYMSCCFLLYRGAPMKPEWLDGWREMVGRKVSKGGKHFRPACLKL